MLLALNIATQVSPLLPSLPDTLSSATGKQRHERYHLPLAFVQQSHSLYYSPFPSTSITLLPSPSLSLSPSHPQLPCHSCSHPLCPSLSRSRCHHPAWLPHPCHHHCHCHRQDHLFHRSASYDMSSSHYHHSCRLSHPNLVVEHPGSRLACTAGKLMAQSLPWDHPYSTKRIPPQCVQHSPSWLSANQSDQLEPKRHGGCATSNWSFGTRFCQTCAPYISGRLPTTPAKANNCYCSAAASAGIVKSGESRLDQARLHHKSSHIHSCPWGSEHRISV